MKKQQHLEVGEHDEGIRLDLWLTKQLDRISRSRVQALIRSGNVTVDGSVPKESHKTRAGESVGITFPDLLPVNIRPEPIPLDIMYQDADITVINKPAGLLTHPVPGRTSGTLVNALLHHCPDLTGIGWKIRPGIVHRLDKDTTGILVAAKNEHALAALQAQFQNRLVHKEYLAIIWGRPEPPESIITTLIARNPGNRTKMSARVSRGRCAVTHYRTVRVFGDMSLVLLRPQTGRTHQLRVHLAHIGHPIAGDLKYGGRPGKGLPVHRQMLHAWKLSFAHPATNRKLSLTAPVPTDMAGLFSPDT